MKSTRTALVLSLTSTAAAQWLNGKPLGSCADIDCPSASNDTIQSSCQVANQTYDGVGIATFPSTITADSSSQNLTWTVAYHDYTNYDPDRNHERTIEKAFFLGTPQNLNLTEERGMHGCAVILEAYNTTWGDNEPWNRFSCNAAIGSNCHTGLVDRALSFAREQQSMTNSTGMNGTENACEKLREYINSTGEGEDEESKCNANWTQVRTFRKFNF